MKIYIIVVFTNNVCITFANTNVEKTCEYFTAKVNIQSFSIVSTHKSLIRFVTEVSHYLLFSSLNSSFLFAEKYHNTLKCFFPELVWY